MTVHSTASYSGPFPTRNGTGLGSPRGNTEERRATASISLTPLEVSRHYDFLLFYYVLSDHYLIRVVVRVEEKILARSIYWVS